MLPKASYISRAGDEARTRDLQLGRLSLYQLSYSRFYLYKDANLTLFCTKFTSSDQAYLIDLWGEQDSNLRSRKTTDLQSVPVGRFGIPPTGIWKNLPLKKRAVQTAYFSNEVQNYTVFLFIQVFEKKRCFF